MSKGTSELAMKEIIAVPLFRIDIAIALVTLLFIAFLVFLGMYELRAPAAAPTSAPLTEFSSGRAMRYLTVIAQHPHPMGTPAHAEVRDYILGELRGLGLQPEIQRTAIVNPRDRPPFLGGTVENVVARIAGTANTKAIVLVAHYDSVPAGPGASDDGAGIAALLETARALKAGPALKNDVILLFSDGEEPRLLGAKAFVSEHRWAKDAGLVMNLEARGNTGPALMFQTSNGNGWLIREFAQAAPYPFASSLFYDLYQVLPNDTDFTEFEEAGIPGFNFAFIDGYLHYHTALDTLANVDERSLQHHGSYVLALTRHFGDLSLENTRETDAVFFNTLGSRFVYYSRAWVIPLLALTALVWLVVAVLGFRRRQLTLSGVILGFLAFLANVIVAPLLVTLLLLVVNTLHPEYRSIPHGEPYNSYLYLISFVAITIAITSALYSLFNKKISVPNLAFGALLGWLVLAVLASLLFQGGSYLFIWPLLFSLIGTGVVFAAKQQENVWTRRFVVPLLCAVPGILLFTPLIYLVAISLTLRLAAVVAAIVALLLGSLIPHLKCMLTPNKWLLPGAAALLSLGFLVAGNMASGFNASQPKPNDVMYAMDADTGKAVWASAEPTPDAWTRQFFAEGVQRARLPQFFPVSPRDLTLGPAPLVSLTAPHIALLDDKTGDGVRTLRMRITSPRQAPVVLVFVGDSTEVLGAAIDGKPIARNDTPAREGSRISWGMTYWAFPSEGLELTLDVKPSGPVHIRVVDRTDGLPEIPGQSFQDRPNSTMIAPSFGNVAQYSNGTLVVKSFTF